MVFICFADRISDRCVGGRSSSDPPSGRPDRKTDLLSGTKTKGRFFPDGERRKDRRFSAVDHYSSGVISDPGTDLISLPSDQSLASTGSGKRDVLADPGSQIS